MKEALVRFGKICFAIAAFGIGAANIVNGTMIMHDIFREDHPCNFTVKWVDPEPATIDTEVPASENNA